MLSVKNAFASVGEFISGLVELLAGLAALGVVSEIIFGGGVYGIHVVENIIGLVNQFGTNGFAGLLSLLILVGLYNRK